MLNHGSFGACPWELLEVQQRLREQMEREPMGFFMRRMEPMLDESRKALAHFLGADPDDLVFVRNVTEGVNSVLRSLSLEPGDELLVTDHAYNACRNVVDFVADRAGAKVVVARVPFPIAGDDEVVDTITACATERTRLALLDHVTSPTALIFPIERLVVELNRLGVDTLVDGAHAPGMIAFDVDHIGAAYYTGNCHKWLCAPKGAGFLHVRRDRQAKIHPAVISHGYNITRDDHPRMHDEFDWTGTGDPTPWLCVAEAVRFLDRLMDGGIESLMHHNHSLALEGQRILRERLDLQPPCPEEMLGSMATLIIGDDTQAVSHHIHPLQQELFLRWGIEVPVWQWPTPPHRLLRISAQAYNSPAQYDHLAQALENLLGTK